MQCKPSRTLLASLVMGLCVSAQAQQFATTPEPGLWRTEVSSEINGEDVIAAIREAQAQMLSQLPPEQRALMEAMLDGEDPGVDEECLDSADLESMTNVQNLFAEMNQDMQGCDLNIDETGRNHMKFSGTCRDHEGFSGDIEGEVVMVSSREMRHTFHGKGIYEMGGELPPGFEGMDGEVDMRHRALSRWVSAQCP